jgi:hypothetical protein
MSDLLTRSLIPSVLNTRPRRVRYLGRTGWLIWGARLFILPHTLVGLVLIGVVILGPFWAMHGVDRTAKVVDASVRRSSDSKKRNTYELTYVHAPFGIERRETESVPLAEFSRVVGTTDGTLPPQGPERPAYKDVRVRGWGNPPFYYEQIVGPEESPWEYYLGPALMCVFWNALLFAFVRPIFYTPWRMRHIYRHGDVDPGLVTNKWEGGGKSPSYWISYEFRVDGKGHTVSGKTQARDQAAYDALMIGQPVAVLHPPGKAKPSAVYEVGLYTCD